MPKGIELFKQRFEGYEGEVILVESEEEAMNAALDIIVKEGAETVGLSRDLEGLLPLLERAGIAYTHERGQGTSPPRIGLTRASGLLAETGSLVIDNENPGERLWSIISGVHIAILNKPVVFKDLDSLFAGNSSILDRGFCLISGPSRTADIEKQLVLGMHGPKRVVTIIAGQAAPSL